MSWENDDRGKPSKWLKTIIVDEADQREHGAVWRDKRAEIDDAVKECIAAVDELIATGEYVVRVPPEIVEDRDMEAMHYRYHIRARVRWCTPENKSKWEAIGRAMLDAATDEERLCLAERAKDST